MGHSRKKAKNSTVTSENVVINAFVGMPMDIIFEIFGYLDPLDLLRLARTTKPLRAILMSRSSLSLWKHARHVYYQMPDGPEGMSEPQYVSLALDLVCDGCGMFDSEAISYHFKVHTFWNAQLKSCQKCESTLLGNASSSSRKKFDLSRVLPSWAIVDLQGKNKYFLLSSYSLKQAKIWSQELSDSSANLEEWQRQFVEKHALMRQHVKSFHSWTLRREREMPIEHQL